MKINKFIYVLTMIILIFSITSCNNSSNSSSDSSSEIINTSDEGIIYGEQKLKI